MTPDKPDDRKQPHELTVRAWPLEVSGRGLGIIGVLVLVLLVLLCLKPDVSTLIELAKAKASVAVAER